MSANVVRDIGAEAEHLSRTARFIREAGMDDALKAVLDLVEARAPHNHV